MLGDSILNNGGIKMKEIMQAIAHAKECTEDVLLELEVLETERKKRYTTAQKRKRDMQRKFCRRQLVAINYALAEILKKHL